MPVSAPPVTFVLPYGYRSGGIPRVVLRLADELSRRGHDVTVLSLVRTADRPFFPVADTVRLDAIMDLRDPRRPGQAIPRPRNRPSAPAALRELDRQPTALAATRYQVFSALTDRRLEARLGAITEGIVVATRPELAVAAVRWTSPGVTTILAEHNTMANRSAGERAALLEITQPGPGRQLDALLLLTDAETTAWRGAIGETTTHVATMTNPLSFTLGPAAPLTARRVISVGRLHAEKGFDRLIDAWRPVADRHPDWSLDIYGEGREQEALQAQIDRLGLAGTVTLAGLTPAVDEEMARSSAFALSSHGEGFGMVILEAMSKGVPPVSFDCPTGPGQLIDNERNGLLVPNHDVPALSAALLRVIEDVELRHRLGRASLDDAAAYALGPTVDRWQQLFAQLRTTPVTAPSRRRLSLRRR